MIEFCINKGYHNISFMFDMETIVVDDGKLVLAQTVVQANNKSVVVFYVDTVAREFKAEYENDHPALDEKNFDRFKKMMLPIITEQIFSISQPRIHTDG